MIVRFLFYLDRNIFIFKYFNRGEKVGKKRNIRTIDEYLKSICRRNIVRMRLLR